MAPRRRCLPIPQTRRWRMAATTCATRPISAAVYARVIDNWLGADSVGILGGNFRGGSPEFL